MFRVLTVFLAAALSLAAARKPVTIEAITSAAASRGFAIHPVWAPSGERFAYTENNAIHVYDVARRSSRELIKLAPLQQAAVRAPKPERFDWTNRRVSQEPVQWSPDERNLLVETGTDLFWVDLNSGNWEQLTSTADVEHDPKLSPDGTRVAFRREHDVYTLDIASKAVTRLTEDGSATLLNGETDWVYPEELDLGTAYWWSPDSTHLAYLQFDVSHEFVYPHADLTGLRAVYEPQRYPQAGTPNADVRLGVVSATGGTTRWMELGETRNRLLARVYWRPDSTGLLVERLNRVQNEMDVLLADAGKGGYRTVLHETDPYWINYSDVFAWIDDATFLWSSERSGFRHLYLYGLDGTEKRQLTSGEWEVDTLAGVDKKRGLVYYVSTEASPLERQLYVIGLDGNGRRRVSEEPGTHAISMAPSTAFYVDRWSNLTTPPSDVLRANDGRRVAELRAPNRKPLEEYDILTPQITTFKTAGGVTLYASLIKPAAFQSGRKYPAIVFVYGGPFVQSVRNAWDDMDWQQVLAHRGFVIWQVDNRGSTGRGHAFETPIYRRFGKVELEDQEEGVRHLISLGFVDPKRVGIYGSSYGGYMTMYSLLNAADVFRAGVADAAVTNWHDYDTIYTERYMGLPQENAAGYRDASAVTYAANLRGELLILHNLEDDNVLFQNTMQMAAALERAGKRFSMEIYPQKRHGVSGSLRRQLLEEATAFFERSLTP